jgi:RNA polymerase sigma-70 factor (ECF subfamily)
MQVADAIARCLAGDKAAYQGVVAAHADQLVAILRPLVGSIDDARDLAQEAFVRAYVNLHRYDARRPFKPWLFRIARNLAYNHLSARKRRPEGRLDAHGETALGAMKSETRSPMVAVLEGERREAVEQVLSEMRPQYREVLVLRYMGRLEYEQIAETMGIPVGTVKTWLNRAKARFRDLARGGEIL